MFGFGSSFRPIAATFFCELSSLALAGELKVSTDFEGGSARVEAIDQAARVIQLMPGGDPQHGWPCWWYARIEGVTPGEHVSVSAAGSDRPARNDGRETGKPLTPSWALPMRAAYSTDSQTWLQTAPGTREGSRMRYEFIAGDGPLWIAWGPPFTPHDTALRLAEWEKAVPTAHAFELAKSRAGRPVNALRMGTPGKPGVWVQARQHAWESGSSWVARGLGDWLVGASAEAAWLRDHAEIVLIPIMDVDNVTTGDGGKEANPRDHNRDWSDEPVYPEVKAAQASLLEWGQAGRLSVFLDLHNPAPNDLNPFFFVGPEDLLNERGRSHRAAFLKFAQGRLNGPLPVEAKTRLTGPTYHPLWRQLSGVWVNTHADPQTVAICLETAWNNPASNTEGYLAVGRQLGQTLADFLKHANTADTTK